MAVELDSLPALVRQYVQQALPAGRWTVNRTRIEQIGDMTIRPGAQPRRFTATEEFATDRVAFTWNARFPIIGPFSLHVTDSYNAGDGLLEVRLLRVPLKRKRGHALAQGEVYRYLAEIAWAPHAILANSQFAWRELDDRTVEVSTDAAGSRVGVRLVFNERGEIEQTLAERPRLESGGEPAPWIGDLADYRKLGGVLIPTRAEVRWELPNGPFTYWRCEVTGLRAAR
jgi:hypothetical protein